MSQDEEKEKETEALVPSQPRAHQMSRRDFAGVSLETGGAATAALVAKSRADIEARWIMAMKMPRNLDDCRQQIIRECKRPGFADVAVYARPVGRVKNERGEWVQSFAEGLSIRFAEAAMRVLGNMSCEVETIYDGDTDRTVRVTVTDFETNAMWRRDVTVKKTVERRQLKKGQQALGTRLNSYGDQVFIVEATDDEVAVKEAALVSKAARTGILRVVPGGLQDEAMALCKRIAADKDAKDPDAARVRMLDAFAAMGVRALDIEDYIGHTTAQFAPAELAQFRSIYSALESGETTWAEIIADRPAKPNGQTQPTSAVAAPPSTKPAEAPAKTGPKKGTAALKETLRPPPAEPPKDVPTSFDKAAADARAKETARNAEAEKEPGSISGKADDKPATDEPKCTDCGVPVIEPGRCYACAASRD